MHRLQKLPENGFSVVLRVFSVQQIEYFRAVTSIVRSDAVRRRGDIYAIRNLLEACLAVRSLAQSPQIRSLVNPVLGNAAFSKYEAFCSTRLPTPPHTSGFDFLSKS
jgi:hypothetical protein